MTQVTVLNNEGPQQEIRAALECAADVLGVDVCWYFRGDFHFRVTDDWTVSITPESAGRVRVETWWKLRPRGRTHWSRAGDYNRLAYLVHDARDSLLQPTDEGRPDGSGASL